MAATLGLLKLPIIPPKHHQQFHPLFPSNPINNDKPLHSPPLKICFSSSHITRIALLSRFKGKPTIFITLKIHFFFYSLQSFPFIVTYLSCVIKQDALAVGGEFGLLEGRSFALIHPIVMCGLFFYTLYAGYMGWQWRRVRTIQNEINELKKELKPVPVTPDGTPAEPPKPSPLDAKIQQLTEERKELIKGSYRDRHFNAGSILLAFGVFESIGGGVNTWFRTGKLFPGPHLFAGAAITVLCCGQQQPLLYLLCKREMKQQEVFTLH